MNCEDMKTDLTETRCEIGETGCVVRHWSELARDKALWFVKSWEFLDG
jgi:hypothetical protein